MIYEGKRVKVEVHGERKVIPLAKAPCGCFAIVITATRKRLQGMLIRTPDEKTNQVMLFDSCFRKSQDTTLGIKTVRLLRKGDEFTVRV